MELINKKIPQKILKQVYAIHKEKLGEGYLNFNHFKKLNKKNKLIIAINNNEVLGFLTFDYSSEKEFFNCKKINLKSDNIAILILNTCAVKIEKMGVGTALIDYALKNLTKNIEKVYTPVWQYSNKINAHKMLTNFGFNPLITLEKYWYAESIGVENFCPVCNTPCTCNLIVYSKNIKAN